MKIYPSACTQLASPSLGQLASVFVRYANFTLGGGSATIAVLHREICERRSWLSEESFALCFGFCRLTPGTNLLAFCVGAGWLRRGFWGAVVALLAASIPCALIVTTMTLAFNSWQGDLLAQAGIHGAIAAAVPVTIKTGWTIAKPHFQGRMRVRVVVVAATAFFLHGTLEVPAIQVLLFAAAAGATVWPRSQ